MRLIYSIRIEILHPFEKKERISVLKLVNNRLRFISHTCSWKDLRSYVKVEISILSLKEPFEVGNRGQIEFAVVG